MEFKLSLKGTIPMLMHNGRLANPLDEHARQIGAISGKKKKTDADLAELARLELRGGMYETEDDHLGLPLRVVWSCIQVGARKYKKGQDVKRALLCDPVTVVPLDIPGCGKVKCDKYLELVPDGMFYASVKVGQARVMRTRPMIPAGWSAEVPFTLDDDVFPWQQLEPCIEWASKYVGLLDWHPLYGRFDWDVVDQQ